MSFSIIILALAWIGFTAHKISGIVRGEYAIPSLFFFSWKFAANLLYMLFAAAFLFYVFSPLTETTFLFLILVVMLGVINSAINTRVKTSELTNC
ncbi:MAG: hypothetical protein JJU46_09100 [Balneolaceae bacterium]|nr:hypothetical protein [Balneolaceae bacterium]MCH8548196.1 hypothetical protein [Balneolaceae bacterium]